MARLRGQRLSVLVETLMFYLPVEWWISGCIREERENCCNDLVIEVCGDRLAYARALAAIPAGILLDIAGLLMLNGVPRIVSTPRPA